MKGTESTPEASANGASHERVRLFCFEHFVEAVEDMHEDAEMSAVGKTADRQWEDDGQIRQAPRLALTPALQDRLDEYLESE